MFKTFVNIWWTLLLSKCIYCGYNYSVVWNENHIGQLDSWFHELNYQHKILSYYTEFYKWEIYVKLQKNLQNDFKEFLKYWLTWKNKKCMEAKNYLDQMSENQQRMIFLLCRGPNYSNFELNELVNILEKIKENYRQTEICLPKNYNICADPQKIWEFTEIYSKKELIYSVKHSRIYPLNDQKSRLSCVGIGPDVTVVNNGKFTRDDCKFADDIMLRWAWVSSRLALNQNSEFVKEFSLMNKAANRNGYHDIVEFWRTELEMHNLDQLVDQLWSKIKYFYKLLHGVLRNVLHKKYNEPIISKYGPLPAHILGSFSSENWAAYLDLLIPLREINLDENFRKKNWTTLQKTKKIEDFYASFGLSRMTRNFWKNSNFSSVGNDYKCQDNFANMFDEYRLYVCTDQSLTDFYKIAYPMGLIEYNMLYSNQSSLFQSPTNSAFGAAIGGVVVLGMITPQHLNRLTLLPDKCLYPKKIQQNKVNLENITGFDSDYSYSDYSAHIFHIDSYQNFKYKMEVPLNDFDLSLLLQMALTKLPKISFEYVIDRVRWNLLSGKINFTSVNEYFWQLIKQQQGIYPQNSKNQPDFIDLSSEFHIANNIPYIPLFLSSFLEVQIFKGLCEYTIYGQFNSGKKILMPLHRCDIYGSKRAGKLLKKALSLGSSVHWSEVLYILTGEREISAIPLLEYYEPLIIWLEKIVHKNDIPLGW